VNKANLNNRSLRSALLLGAASAAALGLAAPAMAQDQSVETVVVTGSRIPQTGLYSTSPVTVVGSQEVQLQNAVNTEQLLNQLPQNIGGMNSGLDISSDGTANVSLRGLGARRTLVLVDGKRYVPSGIGGAVDLDAIPSGMIDHVEVVTGGASAVYGSDAVAGVVNILLKHDFEGVEMNGSYSAYPDYHMDGQTVDLNGLMGFSSGDGKGNVTMWGGYTHRQSIPQGTRKFGAAPLLSDGTGGFFVGGSQTIPQGGFYILNGPHGYPVYNADHTARIGGGDGGFCYNYDPTGNASNPGIYKFSASGTAECDTVAQNRPAADDTFNYNPQQLNQTEQVRYNFGANGHYEVSKALDLYTRVMYSNTRVNTQIASTPVATTLKINADNPFLSAQEKDLLFGTPTPTAATPDANLFLFKRALDFGPRRTEFTFDSFEMVVGAKGDLGGGWNYDVSAQYGKTESQQWSTGYVSNQHFRDSIRVVDDGSGGYACKDPTGTGCTPYNIFNLDPAAPGQISPGVLAYDGVNFAELTQVIETDIQGSVAGDLGSMGVQSPWAKDPVAVSVGAEYRQEQGFVRPDATLSQGDAAGLSGAVPPVSGAFNVKEGFAEVKIPVIEGMPFAEDVELEGAYRYSSYSNAGTTSTYKYGGSWAPTDDFKLRALWQRAVRAPNIGELFSPQSIGLDSGDDPCKASNNPIGNVEALCVATGAHPGQGQTCNSGQCNVLIGGNPNLKPEVADTKTFGVVFTPTFIDGLTATVDYYDIKVTGAVGVAGGSPQGVLDSCYKPLGGITNVAAQAASAACQAVHRDSLGAFRLQDGYISQINANTSLLHPTGIDVDVNYQMDLSSVGWNDAGGLSFNLNGTYQDSYKQQGASNLPVEDCAGYYGNTCSVPDPKYRFNFRVNWTSPSGDWLISGRWRYIGSVKFDDDYCLGKTTTGAGACVVSPANFDLSDHQIDSVSYFDLTGVWNIREGLSLTAGLQNLFNKKPPIVDNTIDANENNSNTFPGVYDIQGRMLFVSGSIKF